MRGLVYFATGKRFINEAHASLKSARSHNSGIQATLFTPDPITSDLFNEVRQYKSSGH